MCVLVVISVRILFGVSHTLKLFNVPFGNLNDVDDVVNSLNGWNGMSGWSDDCVWQL